MKKIALFLGALMLLVLPVGAHASVMGDLENQIGAAVTELQKRILDLQAIQAIIHADPSAMTATTIESFAERSTTSAVPRPRICEIARRLARGTNGGDVSSLQDVLRDQGFFKEATSTSYFGRLTEDALQRWQAAQGIASTGDANSTGWGSAGPKTREHIKSKWCGGAPQPGNCSQEGPVCGMPTNYCPPNAKCIQIVPTPTTYPNECALVEWHAKLLHKGACTGTESNAGTTESGQNPPSSVTVQPPIVCTTLYAPVCGLTGSGIKTFGNRCQLDVAKALFVSFGECTRVPPSNCPIVSFTPIVCSEGQELKPTYDAGGCKTGYQCVANIPPSTTRPTPPPSNCPIVSFTPIVCSEGQELKPTYDAGGCKTGYQCVPTPTPPKLGGGNLGGGGSSSIPDNCKVWFDGCNTCTRFVAGGGPMACTLRACVDLSGQIADGSSKAYCMQTF